MSEPVPARPCPTGKKKPGPQRIAAIALVAVLCGPPPAWADVPIIPLPLQERGYECSALLMGWPMSVFGLREACVIWGNARENWRSLRREIHRSLPDLSSDKSPSANGSHGCR